MKIALYRDFAEPLTDETLFAWHRMVIRGRHDIEAVSSYRKHADVMQVVSGFSHKPKVHFVAEVLDRTDENAGLLQELGFRRRQRRSLPTKIRPVWLLPIPLHEL